MLYQQTVQLNFFKLRAVAYLGGALCHTPFGNHKYENQGQIQIKNLFLTLEKIFPLSTYDCGCMALLFQKFSVRLWPWATINIQEYLNLLKERHKSMYKWAVLTQDLAFAIGQKS